MKPKQEEHLLYILNYFAEKCWDKYQKGVKEHGGNLWEKSGLIDMAIDEAIDQVVYLITLRQQILDAKIKLGYKKEK